MFVYDGCIFPLVIIITRFFPVQPTCFDLYSCPSSTPPLQVEASVQRKIRQEMGMCIVATFRDPRSTVSQIRQYRDCIVDNATAFRCVMFFFSFLLNMAFQ